MLPAAFWLGATWAEKVMLVATVVLVLVVELLNTAIESVVTGGPGLAPAVQARQGRGQRRGAPQPAAVRRNWLTALFDRLSGLSPPGGPFARGRRAVRRAPSTAWRVPVHFMRSWRRAGVTFVTGQDAR
jgi:hypothetical protein